MIKKYISFAYGSFVALIIGLLSTIVITRILDPVELGKFSMYTTFSSVIVMLIIFGADQAFIRYFYNGDIHYQRKLLLKCIYIAFFVFFPIMLVLFIFRKPALLFLFDGYNFNLFIIIVIGIVLQLIYRYILLIYRMNQDGKKYSNFTIFNKLFNLILLIAFYFYLGENYIIAIYSVIFTYLILDFAGIFLQNKFWFRQNYSKESLDNDKKSISYNQIFRFSYPFLFTALLTWGFQSTDKIGIRLLADFNELGLYAAAFKIVAIVTVLQTSFTSFWVPVSYERYHDDSSNKKFYFDVYRFMSLFVLFIALAIITFRSLIIYILGSDYSDSIDIIPFLTLMPLLLLLSEVTVVGINFKKKTKWHILISLISLLINVIGNYFLIKAYGAIGAAISTGISYLVYYFLRTYISNRLFKVNYPTKRFNILIIIILIFAYISIFLLNSISTYFIGLILIILLLLLYKNEIVEIFGHIKKFIKKIK